jgi:hypothetical protein
MGNELTPDAVADAVVPEEELDATPPAEPADQPSATRPKKMRLIGAGPSARPATIILNPVGARQINRQQQPSKQPDL